MKLVIGILKNAILLFCHLISRCIPRNNKVWLYGGFNKRFIDNSKYLFISLSESERGIQHIWMTDTLEDQIFLKKLGFKCLLRKSIKGILISLRAKVYIYSCYPSEVNAFAFSGGAFMFNLWHGVGFKKIEYDITRGPLRENYNPKGILENIKAFSFQPAFFRKSTAILCPVEKFAEIFQNAFKVKRENVCMAPYPRTLPFFWNEAFLIEHIEKFEDKEMQSLVLKCKDYSKVWIYMPTWRDAYPNFLKEALPDMKRLDEVCKKNEILFLIKLHVVNKTSIDLEDFNNVIIIPNNFDIYPLLPFTTTLLTDYSSIFMDYQNLNKKIVFYPFDLEQYLAESREMYFEFDDLAIGDKVYSFEELISFLSKDEIKINEQIVESKRDFLGIEEISSFIKARIDNNTLN